MSLQINISETYKTGLTVFPYKPSASLIPPHPYSGIVQSEQ